MRKKIGVITWHYYCNYGSMLQTYALTAILRDLGMDVTVLNYHNHLVKGKGKHPHLNRCLSYIPYSFIRKFSPRLSQPFYRFRKLYNESPIVFDEKGLKNLISGYSSVVCGSDQIWAPNCYEPVYMLNFVPEEVNKVSYAASIGLNEIPEKLVGDYKKYIGRIDHISVREEKGKEILKSQCGIDSTVVLDPTLLLPVEKWQEIRIGSGIKNAYIFCYFLNTNHCYKESVLLFAKENNLDIYGISDNPNDEEWMHRLEHKIIGPREFLGLINDASAVVTDSYHGTIFSLLHHKRFLTLERFTDDDPICQNSRIYQLAQYFHIDENIVKVDKETRLEMVDVDYEKFDGQLDSLRKNSFAFLKNALS